MPDKVLMYDTIDQAYFLDNYKRTTELNRAKLIDRKVAQDWQQNKPHFNIVELDDAFTSLQMQFRLKDTPEKSKQTCWDCKAEFIGYRNECPDCFRERQNLPRE